MTEFHPILPDKFLFRGRELRKNSTVPEKRLWNAIRGGRLCGIKFRRQHAIGPFFVDFYCHEQRLVVELDGQSHIEQGEYDLDREDYLRDQNLRIIRFTNDQALFDLDSVVRAILVACGRDPDTGAPLNPNGMASSKSAKSQPPLPPR
ncbi:MAG: endonuclease domain-containing protein [Planctomycetaceae bacterium]|nr:endonuclease domain-containing protein [Planctomycetaceae bacterium]